MTVAFETTDAVIHVGRRAKPVPKEVHAAIAASLKSGKHVQSKTPLTEDEFRGVRADFRRAEKELGNVKVTVGKTVDDEGKLYALVFAKKLESSK